MATLTRPKLLIRPTTSPTLTSAIPTPFPREQFRQAQELDRSLEPLVDIEAGPSRSTQIDDHHSSTTHGVLHDLMPSIVSVQKSCIMTLNNLLSMPTRWNPIVPDRRHSMPSTPQAPTPSQVDIESSSSALQTLVTNLRNRDEADDMIEVHTANNDTELLHELRMRVESISSLEPADAIFANALVSLLSHFNRLSVIQATSSRPISGSTDAQSWESTGPPDLFGVLKRQLSDLQIERLSSQPDILAPGAPPVQAVEAALLWNRIDEELETVVALCKERTEGLHKLPLDSLPPQYDPEDYELDTPPQYDESGVRTSIDSSKSRNAPLSPDTAARQIDEKMRLDLEGVAMAIDRLYLVAPQLHNQRVELKSSKLAQMAKASQEGIETPQSHTVKQRAQDAQELDRILDLLGKAAERSISSQSVLLEGNLTNRLERARQKDVAKRSAFVEQLARHSEAGRFHAQDAVLQPRTRDPHTLLSLPEFIQEAVPMGSQLGDPRALLTLPEFVKEPPPLHLHETDLLEPTTSKPKKRQRHRSLSAPALSWLRSSSSKSALNSGGNTMSHSRSRSRGVNVLPSAPTVGFEVHYVAENHENLQHVLVFFTVTGATPGVDIEAEVLPPFPECHAEGSDRLIIHSGLRSSQPLILPARILPGQQEVKVQSGHYQIKMVTVASYTSTHAANEDPRPLLDAAQLSAANPTSFICASCSLPVVQSTKIGEYRDLPSKHWEELVDAWMCHTDQKLHDQVVRHGQGGFWPRPGQALVGGSYILFEESSLARNNLHLADEPKQGEDSRLARCLCGAVIGRCQQHLSDDGSQLTTFRLLKFAIRPVSLTSEPVKIPLSAFIVEDMTEFVQAHATYRFVILDEENELPRLLIWLFKPSIRLAYTTTTPYAIPKSASIHAAKVLYKTLTPSEQAVDIKSILAKYPGFPQAEYLFYPMPVCRRLAGILRESNTTYPQSMREMTGLQVGWLHRV